MESEISALLLLLVGKFPMLTTVLLVVGTLRAVNKPLFALLHAFVEATPSTADDEKLAAVEASGIYKGFTFVLDWFASVKVK